MRMNTRYESTETKRPKGPKERTAHGEPYYPNFNETTNLIFRRKSTIPPNSQPPYLK